MRVLVVTAMYPNRKNPARGTFVKEQVDSLIKSGIDVEVFSFGRDTGVGYLKAIVEFRRVISKNRFDLIHAHFGLTGIVARMQIGVPVIITYHGSDLLNPIQFDSITSLKKTMAVIISRLVSLFASKCIVVSSDLHDRLLPVGSEIIPMGVDTDLFVPVDMREARSVAGLPLDKKLVLFPANPDNKVKRYDLACAVISRLSEKKSGVEMVALQNVEHHIVPYYMNGCNVMLLTSDHEASPTVVKEAMACNLPIVTVRVGDVEERLNGADCCYICDSDPEILSEKIKLLFESYKRPSLRHLVESLSLQNISGRVIEVYNKVAGVQKQE